MGLYAISTIPIIKNLQDSNLYDADCDNLWQAWSADDSSAAGNLTAIEKWWRRLTDIGPKYGYFPNPRKCVLIVKGEATKLRAESFLKDKA